MSGVHVTFNTEEEAGALEAAGFSTRLGLQFHWDNLRQPVGRECVVVVSLVLVVSMRHSKALHSSCCAHAMKSSASSMHP